VLTTGEQALAVRTPTPDNELLATELARLDRKLDALDAERRRLIDLYQAGLVELPELQRRDADVEHRRHDLEQRRDALTAQRQQLTRDNQLRHRVRHFANRVLDVIDTLDFDQKQTLLRLVVEEVHVTGWHVQIRLRIPLDDPDGPPRPPNPDPGPDQPGPLSTKDRLRSLGAYQPAVPAQDRGRSDEAVRAQRGGQALDECSEQGAVGPVQARSRVGSAEHGDLVAQDEQLDVPWTTMRGGAASASSLASSRSGRADARTRLRSCLAVDHRRS
jgi:hypothetical protein